MKKAFFLVLLVPILTIGLISCDASIRSNIADFMGGFSGNVYVEAGLVEPNKADVEAAVAAIATIGTGTGASVVTAGSSNSELGVAVTVPAGVTKILAPQSAAEQEDLKTDLAATLNSPTQTATLLTELAKPITDATQQAAAQGTVKVFNATLDALQTSLSGADAELKTAIDKLELPEIDDPSTLTQGDVLVLQMMTNLISNTVDKLEAVGGGNLSGVTAGTIETNKTQLLSIVDDALFTAQMAEQISGAASIDFSGQLDLATLLDNLNDDSSSSIKSRTGATIDLGDAGEVLGTINGIVPDILKLMGITKSGNTFDYTDAKYRSFILNQKTYRSAMEHGMIFKWKGRINKADLLNANLDTSTLIKYALAVFVTEHDAYVKYKNDADITSYKANDIIEDFLNDNPDLGNGVLTETSTLVEPDLVSGFYDAWETFLKTRTEQYYRNIVSTLLEINKSGGIAQLTTELEDFLDDSKADSLDDWFAGL